MSRQLIKHVLQRTDYGSDDVPDGAAGHCSTNDNANCMAVHHTHVAAPPACHLAPRAQKHSQDACERRALGEGNIPSAATRGH